MNLQIKIPCENQPTDFITFHYENDDNNEYINIVMENVGQLTEVTINLKDLAKAIHMLCTEVE